MLDRSKIIFEWRSVSQENGLPGSRSKSQWVMDRLAVSQGVATTHVLPEFWLWATEYAEGGEPKGFYIYNGDVGTQGPFETFDKANKFCRRIARHKGLQILPDRYRVLL